jgi:hypothetical protein
MAPAGNRRLAKAVLLARPQLGRYSAPMISGLAATGCVRSRARQFQDPCSCENRARKRQKNSDEPVLRGRRPDTILPVTGKGRSWPWQFSRALGNRLRRSRGRHEPMAVSASRMHRLPITEPGPLQVRTIAKRRIGLWCAVTPLLA